MDIQDKIAVITGGASGIGKELAERFHAEGARHVAVVDRDEGGARAVAESVGGSGFGLDVSDEAAIRDLVATVERDQGPIDVFVSNAGYVTVGGLEVSNEEIEQMWAVHVMAHIYAARAVLPSMIERGEGYILNTASAAGLLSQIGSLAYSVTKHAAVAFAEWLAITHGHQGIKVSVLCPQAVRTNIGLNSPSLDKMKGGPPVASGDGNLEPSVVADVVMDAMRAERFWMLPHPEVAEYARRKGTDIERWLSGMQRFQQQLFAGNPLPGDWLVAKDSD